MRGFHDTLDISRGSNIGNSIELWQKEWCMTLFYGVWGGNSSE